MAYSRDYPNSIIPKGSKVVECLQNDDKELKRILGILSDIGVMSLFGSKRQCVLHAATGTDGKPSYITANGLNVVIDGSTTPVIVTFAGGYNANGTVDKTDTIVDTVNAWTMPANGTYYLYIDKDMSTGILSYGHTTIPDTYATTAPESPTLDQCYFNTVEMKMYHYNSSAWEQKLRVFVAKAVTTADTATITIYPFTSRATPSNLVQYDSDGNLQVVDNAGALAQLTASKFIGAVSGNSATASTLATPRTIALSGKATGTATSFDGSGNIAIPVTAVTADSCAGNSATANKWATARTLTLTGNTTGSASIDGSGNVSIATTTSYATSAGAASSCTGNSATASAVRSDPAAGSGADLVYSRMADNDLFRIRTSGGSNAGEVELATADDGNEPIYVRQYLGVFTSIARTATLLDGNGNTSFPGTVTAPTFSGSLSGTASNSDTVDGWHLQSILNRISASNTGGIVAQSLGTNGYAKWSTGLILQWGVITAKSDLTVYNLPISFSAAFEIVASYGGETDDSYTGVAGLTARPYSQSQFRAAIWGANGKQYIRYIAIGY
jgi:hypothetical protein